MLAIRMQRTGRRGHAMFRVIVQESRLTPTSGKVVARLGNYDPHTKAITLNKEKAAFYLEHGAQPSDRVVRLLKGEGVKLPAWVKLPADKERTVRNAAKRRSTRPAEAATESPAPEAAEEAAPADSEAAEEPVAETAQSPEETESPAAPTGETETAEVEAPETVDAEATKETEKTEEKPAASPPDKPAKEA